jgi:hypothetical protein
MFHRLLLLALVIFVPVVKAQASWQSMSPTTGRSGGNFFVTVVGLNFATAVGNTYRCVFEMSARSITITSNPVSALSATRVVCQAPAFPGAGNTVFKVITQTGSTVIKSGSATSVFVFALPVASITGPTVFTMPDCGFLQTLTLTVSMFHPTSNLVVNSTQLVDLHTGAVVASGQLSSSVPAKQYSVFFTWTPTFLSIERVSRSLNFSVRVSEVDFSLPDTVEVWMQVRAANAVKFISPWLIHFSDRR